MREGKDNREEAIKPALEKKIGGKTLHICYGSKVSDPRGRRQKQEKKRKLKR